MKKYFEIAKKWNVECCRAAQTKTTEHLLRHPAVLLLLFALFVRRVFGFIRRVFQNVAGLAAKQIA